MSQGRRSPKGGAFETFNITHFLLCSSASRLLNVYQEEQKLLFCVCMALNIISPCDLMTALRLGGQYVLYSKRGGEGAVRFKIES